jgi:contractile injection system tube protein/LysM domain-containing protein
MSIQNPGGAASRAASRTRSLQKVLIKHETMRPRDYSTGRFTALFNPSELRYSREASWDVQSVGGLLPLGGAQRVAFHNVKPQTLAIELFFDTYEGAPQLATDGFARAQRAPATELSQVAGPPSAVDVTPYTNQVARLATIFPELHRPPRCELWWGQYCLIRGVLTSLSEQYTYFLPDGTPVRATLSCTFTEAVDASLRSLLPELHSADVPKRRVVRRGDTLSSIALEVYNDASLWRHIAVANGIDDPRAIQPGKVLLIPKLREGGAP